ncbi:inorganic triphosphatase [Thalassotalea maritima]|uniref:CYTH domain-containing protein n=1 Tax=Thalassotalea maritima TaxID=3242416 RepID=UPI003527333E
MNTEIELKYLLKDDDVDNKLAGLLTRHNIAYTHSKKHLINSYYDTPELALRNADIGLRIREFEDASKEQTIKLAGTVIGGLHQRPEFNVMVDSNVPDLALFDATIWPETIDVEQINIRLQRLFTTNFVRSSYMISDPQGNQLELVFDSGTIANSQHNVGIHELEIELIDGDSSFIFDLAKLLFAEFTMRPGVQSKAARGYQLANLQDESPLDDDRDLVLALTPDDDLIHSFQAGLGQCLTYMQAQIERYLNDHDLLVLKRITDTLALVRHGIWLYKDYLPEQQADLLRQQIKHILTELCWVKTACQIKELTDKKGNYRRKIENSDLLLEQLKEQKHQLVDVNDVAALLMSEQFNLLQLSMLQLTIADWTTLQTDTTLMDLAKSWLSIHRDSLHEHMAADIDLGATDYINHHKQVIFSLLTGCWFGRLFMDSNRQEYRGPWLDIHQGVDELETLYFLKHYLQQHGEQPATNLVMWIDEKIDVLLLALEQCRQVAFTLRPYWL